MPRFCVMYGCGNREDRDGGRYFRLPAELTKGSDLKKELSKKRRQRWLDVIKRANISETTKKYMWICSNHFISGSPADLFDKENPDWIPSQNLGYQTTSSPSIAAVDRYNRASRRKVLQCDDAADEVIEVDIQPEEETEIQSAPTQVDQFSQTELTMAQIDALIQENTALGKANQDYVEEVCSLKERLKKTELSEESFQEDHEKVRYYTGLHSFDVFKVVFDLVEPYIKESPRMLLNKFQQVLLTFMRMRLNLDFHDLAYRFGICQTTSSKTFYVCLDVLFQRLQAFVVWPDRDTLRCRMPPVFQEVFGKRVTVIVDCFEVQTERPSNPTAKVQTWSNYKHHNTVKFLIGICPQGTISFISRAWGGRTSDKHITENCGILEKLIPHDLILADRGFDIADAVSLCCCEVQLPSFKRGKKQLSALEVEETRALASVRIHVERVIGVLRQKYRILEGRMTIVMISEKQGEVSIINKILTVTSALVNLCPSLMSYD